MTTPLKTGPATESSLGRDVAKLLVDSLRLEMQPEHIDPSAALFGDGLGLDSIDMLEIALVVSKRYGVELRSENRAAFGSLRALAAHIAGNRTK